MAGDVRRSASGDGAQKSLAQQVAFKSVMQPGSFACRAHGQGGHAHAHIDMYIHIGARVHSWGRMHAARLALQTTHLLQR